MGLSRTGFEVGFGRILLVPAILVNLALHGTAQPTASSAAEAQKVADADKLAGNLRQVAKELNEAVNRFHAHLDDAIARYDRGYRTVDGGQVQAADVDLGQGQADLAFEARRKLMIARILAAKGPEPSVVAAANHLQDLISEARGYMDANDVLLQRLLLVSVKELDTRKQALWKAKHDQLRRARAAAEESAKKALMALPIDLREGDSAEEKKEKAWNLLVTGGSTSDEPRPAARRDAPVSTQKVVRLLPIRWTPYQRTTLIHELGYYMALTDSGTEDRDGRHIFYQEEWGQRGPGVVFRTRWRVGVDTRTGQHVLIKRYRPRELHGDVDELYKADLDYLWYLEPPEESAEPSREEVETAIGDLARSRDKVRDAIQEFKNAIHHALSRNEMSLDAGLPDEIREMLFAIRGHIAGAAEVLDPEKRVREAVRAANESIRKLEPLAAWANRSTPGQDSSTTMSALDWERLQERSDSEILLTDHVSKQAFATLPPALPANTASFPALQKDLVVHVLRRALKGSSATINLMQEVWRLEVGAGGSRRVRRSAALISIDSQSGSQKLLGGNTKYYTVAPGGTAEETYDQYAAQDLPLRPLQP
jgi:hypothetical protein